MPVMGSVVRIQVEIKDDDGTYVDPSTLVFKLLAPSGALTTYTYPASIQLVNDSDGIYHVNYNVDEPGIWTYRFESTGPGEGASEDTFEVARSSF
jgi:hypothetical protein